MNKKWEYIKRDKEKVKNISEKYKLSEILATILVNRGVVEDQDIKVFLNPTRNDFHNPYDLPDMEKAVERIKKAIKVQEKVIIYGDYDVDGITSVTVLKEFLSELGLEVDYYIPNRLKEGYGLNKEAIENFIKEKCNLVITVDCGISSHEEIEYINTLNIDVIVTDHHEPLKTLPKALAVINPKRIDSSYPFRELAGVGVVFKLIQALAISFNLEPKAYLKYLDLVCIGTVSDIVPLINENRVITKLGLELIKQTRNIGLECLIKSSELKNINSNVISFGIAPRINACGRMGHQTEAVKLFLTKDIAKAMEITDNLNNYNKERQVVEKEILREVIEKIEKEKLLEKDFIILAGENWHHGVIGIVASKITEIYYKPTILLSIEDDMTTGSGRSIPGFDLHNALCENSELLERYGGHEMAVGLKLPKKNFNKLKTALKDMVNTIEIPSVVPVIYIDMLLNLNDIEKFNVDELQMLEPYGEANKVPIFAIKNLKINSIRALSDGKHLKMKLKIGNKTIDAIGFNMGYLSNEFQLGDKVDVCGIIEMNDFGGNKQLQVNLKSVMKSF
ncbi:MAG: single-stranded-DNA-specific exonuclease RecJ [Oscillospiraceae bacterium]|nr:single-stranded-DNA-specific exonuclease RecJ [Oscillospiraceae bacterium]